MARSTAACKFLYFGRQVYLEGLRIQESLFDRVKNMEGNCHYVCAFEHPPVYTVGLREHIYSAEEEERLKRSGAEFHRVKRGGLITFHGPGQIVVYPIFNLRFLNDSSGASVGVKRYVSLIEDLLVDLLTTRYKIRNVGRAQDTGVWVDNQRKIAAIGIQVKSGVTSHGFALNCNTDLSWFRKIVPCGIEGKATTSISQELGKDVSIDDVLGPVCEGFEKTFGLPVHLHSPDSSSIPTRSFYEK